MFNSEDARQNQRLGKHPSFLQFFARPRIEYF